MSHELSNLSVIPGSRRQVRRLGRGIGSGLGKTAGRGTKGQKSRSGSNLSPGFEGGQMPIQRRLPKRGFVNVFAVACDIVNVGALERFESGAVVDVEVLKQAGLVSGNRPVKVLANGTVTKALTVKANAYSAEALKKIQASGGKVEEV